VVDDLAGIVWLDMSDLCRHNDVVPVPAEVLDGAAHDALRLAASVAFSSVEEVDASVEGGFEASECVLVANMSSIWGC
jgi:hypothetical protein